MNRQKPLAALNNLAAPLKTSQSKQENAAHANAAHTNTAHTKVASFSLLYESRDGRLCIFEDERGHLTSVRSDRFA